VNDIIEQMKAIPAEFAPARYKPLTKEERDVLNALPNSLADRVFAAAMRSAWDKYMEAACAALERSDQVSASALRYEE
jgi:hypothetical protein